MPEFRPGKPTCHAALTSSPSLPAGLNTITWDVAREDPIGQLAGDKIVVERPGIYVVSFGVGRNSVAVSSAISAQLRVGGVALSGQNNAASTAALLLSGSRCMFLDALEEVSLSCVLHSSASAVLAQNTTYLTIDRVGPVKWT